MGKPGKIGELGRWAERGGSFHLRPSLLEWGVRIWGNMNGRFFGGYDRVEDFPPSMRNGRLFGEYFELRTSILQWGVRYEELEGCLEDVTEAEAPWMRRIRLSGEWGLAQVCVMHRGYMGGCWARIYAIDANVYNDILSVITQIHFLFYHFIIRMYMQSDMYSL